MVNHYNSNYDLLPLFFLITGNCVAQNIQTFKGEFTKAEIWEGHASYTFRNKGSEKMTFEFDDNYPIQAPCNFFDENMYTNTKFIGCWFKMKYSTSTEIRETEEPLRIHKIISLKPVRKKKNVNVLTNGIFLR